MGPVVNADLSTKPCPDPGEGREGRDRTTLDLGEEALIKAVLAANRRTVVIVVSDRVSFGSARHAEAVAPKADDSPISPANPCVEFFPGKPSSRLRSGDLEVRPLSRFLLAGIAR
jgi:hypothetical protein